MSKNDVIVINYTGRKGGGALDAFEMAKALVENGVNIVPIISSKIENLEMWRTVRFKRLIVIDTYDNYVSFAIKTILFPVCVKPKVLRETKDLNVKAIYSPMGTFWSDKINKLFPKAKTVMTIHDPIPHSGTNWYTKLAIRAFSSSYDVIVVHSKVFVDEVKKLNKSEQVIYIPLGRHNIYRWATEKKSIIKYDVNKINFVFFGRLEEYKGLDVLAKAWMILDAKYHVNVSLSIVGNGDFSLYRELYQNFTNVEIINRWIDYGEVESVFTGENLVCICPYKDGTQSGVILVALDYGVPVIATDTGGIGEQIIDGKTGYLIETNNVDALVKTMEKFVLDKKLIEIMKTEIQTYIAGISWNKSAKKLMEIIGEIA